MKFKCLLFLPLLVASLQALDYTGSVSPNPPTSGISDLIIGSSSPGSLSISDGEVFSASGFVQVGRSGYGTLDINSGASFQIAEGGNIWIARYLASNGAVVTLNGLGSLLATPAMRLGNSRAGTLNITNNARVEVSGTIQINNNSSVIQISKGGTLQAGQIPMYRESEEYGSRGTFTIDLDNAYKSDYAVVSNELGLDHPTKGYASLNITNSNNLIPQNGESFLLFSVDTLLDNSPFRSFPEGSIVYSDEDVKLLITYAGGDGNDITLSVVSDLTFTLNSDGTEYSVTDCLTSASGSLDIPSTYNGLPVTSIGEEAFYRCDNLTSVTIPDSVTSIGEEAFWACTDLASVTIGDGVVSIGYLAFHGCSGLTSITIPGSVTLIGRNAFYNCGLTSVTIGDGVTSIEEFAFGGCLNLTNITIPDSVTLIGSGAFYNCQSLPSITIPDSVTLIGDRFFEWCPNLTSVTFEGDAPTFGTGVFANSDSAIIYYDSNRSGWTNTVAGRPAVPYNSGSGLIAYYPFNGNANDESGNEINGQTADHVSFSSDRFGNPNSALRIEGERSNIDGFGVTGSGIDLRDSSVSISFWYQKQVDDYHDWVIGVGDDGNCWIVNIDYSAPDGIGWGVWNDDNLRYNLDPPLALEQWCHVVVTYDKNDTKKCIYVDGELVSEGYTDSSFTGTSNFKFGASGITLDDLRFYNRALSANEVSAIYDYDPGLIAYYPLLSGLSDVSGNERHGNGVGVTFENGYLDVGSNPNSTGESYFSIPSSVDQFGQNDFTVSFWFRTTVTDHSNSDGSKLFDIAGDRTESAIGNYISIRMHSADDFYAINGAESLNGGLVIELREGGSSYNPSYIQLGSIVGGLNNGHWHNLSITRGQNTICTYLNGLETSRITSEQITDINNTKPFKLGRSYSGWSSNPNINYKHLKIYDRELSSSEINKAYYEALYNTKNYELVDLRSQGQADVTTTPSDYDLHTPIEMTAARSDSRTLGQQDVISSPSDYNLMGAEGVFDMRVSQPGISTDGDKASMNFTIQSSNDLEEWNNEETIRRKYTMPSDKNFMRVSVGPQLEPEPLVAIATDTYGDKLVYDESNNLYVNDANTPLMIDGENLNTDSYSGWNFYAIESTDSGYICIIKSNTLIYAFTFDSDGNYISASSVVDLSLYESLLGQSLN